MTDPALIFLLREQNEELRMIRKTLQSLLRSGARRDIPVEELPDLETYFERMEDDHK